ncbi:MAG: glycosyltransferase [Alphaproteobacteria bacterium]|nr:glycosyltransferase [Alphaproteobacteria bacterium]
MPGRKPASTTTFGGAKPSSARSGRCMRKPSGARILHVLPAAPFGGLQVVVMALAQAQRERGWHVSIALTNRAAQATDMARDAGLSVVQLGPSRPSAVRRLARLARDPEVVVQSHCEPLWASLVLALACPTRWLAHLHVYPDSRVSLRKSCGNWLQARFAHGFVAISESVKASAVACGMASPDRMPVAYNGIRQMPAGPPPGRNGRGPFRIGFVGRVVREKGIFEFIDCAARFRDRTDVRFAVYGQGAELDEARTYAEALGLDGKVDFRGFVADMEEVWRELDVLAMLSVREPFGLVVLEAIAHGVAVIGYRNASGGAELLGKLDGGYLVAVDDPDALASLILTLKNDGDGLGTALARGAATVRSEFSMDAMERRMGAAYAQLLGPAAPVPPPPGRVLLDSR